MAEVSVSELSKQLRDAITQLDLTEIPKLRDGVFPGCLPSPETFYFYLREDGYLYLEKK